jgi:HD-GYP domain-containing protein (c-di-GMP phosphodiesterase class II)
MFEHEDILKELNRNLPIDKKLAAVHQVLKRHFNFIDRIAIALYEPKTDMLNTYVNSSEGESPLVHYEARLSDATSLRDILNSGRPRVVDDLSIFSRGEHVHSEKIFAHGYRSSYTMPMYISDNFFGFVFFDSLQKAAFTPSVLNYLDVFGHLISLAVINEISQIHTLLAAVKSAREITHQRDPETGAHLDRMARYAHLIAKEIADECGFDDEMIEHVFLFAPLHDLGKIGIPDRILLKPGPLNEQEFAEMKTHAARGREIIDEMIADFGLESMQHVAILRNIAQYHHEAIDGSGYPKGLHGKEIPIEARIVAVADIFDALTSVRPYKKAWSNNAAFDALRKLAGVKLDRQCVGALVRQREKVEIIQARFREDVYG